MEQTEPQAAALPERIRRAWTQLTLEGTALAAAGALLYRIGLQIPDTRPDLGFVFLVAALLHASGFLRFVRRAADFIGLECPHCEQSFHGVPDRLPRPFRSRCAHCDAPA